MSANHKAGDSFTRLMQIPAEYANGYFAGWTVRCQVRNEDDSLLAEAVCEWLDPATTRNLKVRVANTSAWPVGLKLIDIQFTRTADGEVMSTTTARFYVEADVTR